jgi:hypothetical protein
MVFKRRKLIIFLIALVIGIGIGIVIFANGFSTILAEVATGSAIDRNEQKYWVTTGVGGANKISCSQEQYDKYAGDTSIGRTDTLFVVIYERKLLIPSQQKVIQVKKFKVYWNDALHKRIIPNKTYYRLVQEDFTSINNRKSIIIRLYECYQSGDSQMKLVADNIVTSYFDNINSAKDWIKRKNNNLQLKPLTIVSDSVLNKWKQEDYVPTIEYYASSPQGLTYEELMKQ